MRIKERRKRRRVKRKEREADWRNWSMSPRKRLESQAQIPGVALCPLMATVFPVVSNAAWMGAKVKKEKEIKERKNKGKGARNNDRYIYI